MIYTVVITLMLTFASTVRWPRFAYKGSRTELSRLQRLACDAITGAKNMAPTAAVNILLGFPHLDVMTEAKAQAGICRLMCNNSGNLYPHILVMLENLGRESVNPTYRCGMRG